MNIKGLKSLFRLEWVLGGVFLAAAVFLYIYDVRYPGPLDYARNKVFDFYQQQYPRPVPPKARQPVVIIDLDEESLRDIGQWPWPRKALAQLVENTFAFGAKQFAFDVVFAEPDRLNPDAIADGLFAADPELAGTLRALPSNDEVFAKTIAQYPVVLGQAAFWDQLPEEDGPPKRQTIALIMDGEGAEPERFIADFPSFIRNIPIIEDAARGYGIFSILPEADGIVRRVPALFRYDNNLFPALSVEMLRVATNRPTILVKSNAAGIESVGIQKAIQIPTDRHGRVWPYFSKSDQTRYISAKDVLAGTVDPALVQGRWAILGASAVGLMDIRAVPTEPAIPGVEIHAQVIESILTQQFLMRPNIADSIELTLLIGIGLVMIFLVPWLGARWTLLLFLAFAASASFVSWYAFIEHRWLLDTSYPVVSIFLLYSILTYVGYAREEKEREKVRSAFEHYLSPDLVDRLAEDPGQLRLGGAKRDMTLLFCDVRGFTSIAEQYDAERLTKLLNTLLTPLTNVVLENRGTVDKYMGDCIMAFWNAPLDDDQHAKHACMSALGMLAEMQPLNDEIEQQAIKQGCQHLPLKIGLGLNSGEAVVGNMGSDQRFDYSVLGDTVNLAYRFEEKSKDYGVNIVIGRPTNDQVKDQFATLKLDNVKVRGKTQVVEIYALLGGEDMLASDDFERLKADHDAMLTAYRAQNWHEARARLTSARVLGDKQPFMLSDFYDLYENRMTYLTSHPPKADWDGVFIENPK